MDFQALERGYRPFDLKAGQKQTKGKKKDILTDQISTGGGIGGALAGGAAGASLGSVIPGLGTVIGGLAGAILGGAAGSGGGELAENYITGEEDKLKNVGQEALLGGLFSAPPIRAAKGIMGAAKGIGSTGVKEGFEQGFTKPGMIAKLTGRGNAPLPSTAPQNVGRDVPENMAGVPEIPLKTGLQGKMQNLGNKALLSQYGTISKPVARSSNPTQTIGELADYGITNPEDAERIARAVTGSGGIINKAVAKSVDKAGGVDTTNLRRIAEDALQLNGVVEKDAKSVLSIVDAQLRRLQGGPAGSLNPKANPNDALDVMRTLERRIADLTGRGGNARLATGERADQAKALQQVHDEIEERLYRGAGANENIAKVLTPEVREQLLSLRPGDTNWTRYVDERVMNARGIEDLRSAQAPFVKVGKIIDDADQNSITFGGRTGNLANSLNGASLGGALASAVANVAQPVVARYGGTALRDAAMRTPTSSAAKSTIVNTPSGAGSKVGAVSRLGVSAPLASSGIDMLQGDVPDPSTPQTLSDTLTTSPPTNNPITTSLSPYTRESLIADLQRDPENAEDYIGQYQALQEIYAPAKEKGKLNATQLETANRAQNALRDLEVLGGAVESGDILKTAIPGSGSALGGSLLGTTDIESALFNIGDVILRARTGAQAPESEVRAFIAGFLPRGGESKEAQLNKLQRVYRELSGMANPVAAQSNDLASALASAGR